MMRRQPPPGYVYVDALAPLYRKPVDWARERAEKGDFKTAKQWSYTISPRRGEEGTRRTYCWWIMEWGEYLEIVNNLATKREQFFVDISITFGPYEDNEMASIAAMEFNDQLVQSYGDGAVSISGGVRKEGEQ